MGKKDYENSRDEMNDLELVTFYHALSVFTVYIKPQAPRITDCHISSFGQVNMTVNSTYDCWDVSLCNWANMMTCINRPDGTFSFIQIEIRVRYNPFT